ncbi:unnamed protein product [Chondrus crispus]|uniref:Uncharacterized protein n=1 Tax=Chondrus crispus TaxID=2769 RepID=R7QQW3_CHOCR|nr:unnamed protein product [Chondrus crispus]CDF39780.1 unnamed protein product [Chondrus crispus]|eukprot:XP_005710074.1 unnamed protein product [Chondrus crispus]
MKEVGEICMYVRQQGIRASASRSAVYWESTAHVSD